MPWRQPRLALVVRLGIRRRRRVKWYLQADSPRQGPDWHPAGRLTAARWEGAKGRDARIRPPLLRPRPIRLGQRLVREEVSVLQAATPYRRFEGDFTQRTGPLYPVTRAHSLWRSQMDTTPLPRPRARLCFTSPLFSTSPCTPLTSLPSMKSLGPPAFPQALSPDPFPDPGRCQARTGWTTLQD